MGDLKVSALSAIPQGDMDDTVLLYVVDTIAGDVSNKVTKANFFAGTAKTQLTLTLPSGPTGSSSEFRGAIYVPAGTITFATTAQYGDYFTGRLGQATLVDATGSNTITNAATLVIDGAPIASTGVTITNNYAFWVKAGTTLLQATTVAGTLTMSGANISLGANQLQTTGFNYLESSSVLQIKYGTTLLARIDSAMPTSHSWGHPSGIEQHSTTKKFTEYFSGNAINTSIWTENTITGSPTFAMSDGIGDGYTISGTNINASINFNNKRNFNPASCTIYGIVSFTNQGNENTWFGISDNSTFDTGGGGNAIGIHLVGNGNIKLWTMSAGTRTDTDSGVSSGTGDVPFKIVCGASSVNLYLLVSGVWTLKATSTTNLPTAACQPHGQTFTASGTTTAHFKFFEVQND